MNNFIYENKNKVFFGKGGVKEYLTCLLKHYGETVMLAYGSGSIKRKMYAKMIPPVDKQKEWQPSSAVFLHTKSTMQRPSEGNCTVQFIFVSDYFTLLTSATQASCTFCAAAALIAVAFSGSALSCSYTS